MIQNRSMKTSHRKVIYIFNHCCKIISQVANSHDVERSIAAFQPGNDPAAAKDNPIEDDTKAAGDSAVDTKAAADAVKADPAVASKKKKKGGSKGKSKSEKDSAVNLEEAGNEMAIKDDTIKDDTVIDDRVKADAVKDDAVKDVTVKVDVTEKVEGATEESTEQVAAKEVLNQSEQATTQDQKGPADGA